MKKLFTTVLILCLALFVLDGCTSTNPPLAKNEQTLPQEPPQIVPQSTDKDLPTPPAFPEE